MEVKGGLHTSYLILHNLPGSSDDMADLAQLASKLHAKDGERSVLADDIKSCEALKREGKEIEHTQTLE